MRPFSQQTPRPGRRWWARPEALAALAAVVAHLNVLPNDYCFDDVAIVAESAKVNEPGRWGEVWTTDHWFASRDANPERDLLYRPVSLSSHRLVRLVSGGGPLAPHLVNVLLHALICVCVVQLCRHAGAGDRACAVAGVLFAVLPIHTEAVAPVVGRSDLLATLGVLLALLLHRRSMAQVPPGSSSVWRGVAGLAAFLAMGSKESGVTVVALVPLFDAYWSARERGEGVRFRVVRSALVRSMYLLVPLGVYVALRFYALGGALHQTPPLTKTVNILVEAPAWQRCLGALQLWGIYWAKTVWPAVLSIKYTINSLRLATGIGDMHVLIGLAALFTLIAVSAAAWHRGNRAYAVLTAALLVSYLPTSNTVMLMRVFLAERTWYLPSVWAVVLAALLAAPILHRRLAWAAFGLVAVGMIGRCWIRGNDWRNNGTLYTAAVANQPHGAGPLELLGSWLVGQSERKGGAGVIDGLRLLNRAIEIDPGFTDAHRSLGRAHLLAGNRAAALKHLQIAEMQVPGHAPTADALARLARDMAEDDDELARRSRAAATGDGDLETILALLRRQRDLGLVAEALETLARYDDRFADSALWHAEYAVTLVMRNNRDAAIARYGRALEIDPDRPQQAVELASLLRERGRGDDVEQAWKWSERAYRLAPGRASVLFCRGELLVVRGDRAAAGDAFRAAIRALPPGSPARTAYRERAAALGFRIDATEAP